MKCKKGYKNKDGKCVKKKSNVKSTFNPQNYAWIIYSIIGIVAVSFFIYGGTQGWYKGESLSITNNDINNFLNQDPSTPSSCTLDLNPNSIYSGDLVTGTIYDGANTHCYVIANDGSGWVIVYEGDTDANGFLINTRNVDPIGNFVFRAVCDINHNGAMDTGDCLTNKETLNVLARPDDPVDPLPDPYEVGDNVGSGTGGSGDGNFGDDIESLITMDWTTGGPYVLGAKITRSWDYKFPTDPDCYQGPEQYPMEWTLYDSNGMAWQKYDYVPVNNLVDTVCPVTYHEDAPWKFVVSVGIQACEVEYSWNVQPYICEVNE